MTSSHPLAPSPPAGIAECRWMLPELTRHRDAAPVHSRQRKTPAICGVFLRWTRRESNRVQLPQPRAYGKHRGGTRAFRPDLTDESSPIGATEGALRED